MSKREQAILMCIVRTSVAFTCIFFGIVAVALGLDNLHDGLPFLWKLCSGMVGLAIGLFLMLDAIRRME